MCCDVTRWTVTMSQDRGHSKSVGPAVIRLTTNILLVRHSKGADEVHSDNSVNNKDRNRTLLEWECASTKNDNGKWLRGGWRWGRVRRWLNYTCLCRTQYLSNAHTHVEQSTNLERSAYHRWICIDDRRFCISVEDNIFILLSDCFYLRGFTFKRQTSNYFLNSFYECVATSLSGLCRKRQTTLSLHSYTELHRVRRALCG